MNRFAAALVASSVVVGAILGACATPPAPSPSPSIPSQPASSSAIPIASVNADAAPPIVVVPSPSDAIEIAVGEAMLIEGTVSSSSPSRKSRTVDTMGFTSKQLVVIGVAPGDATVAIEGGGEKHFRVVPELCRPQPLHPAIVLDVNDRATFDPGVKHTQIENARREPAAWIVAAHNGEVPGEITVVGQAPGHTTVIVVKEDRTALLYDVFVGGACRDKAYTSITPAIPPGLLGPKGDGTCIRTNDGKSTAVRCPDLAKVVAMPDERFSPVACEWAASCGVQGHERCCVGCKHPFRMKLSRPCATKMLRAKTCAEVQKLFSAPSCLQ